MAASLALLGYASGAAADSTFDTEYTSLPVARQWEQPDWTLDVLAIPASRRADQAANEAAVAIHGRAFPVEVPVSAPNDLDAVLSLDIKSTYSYLRATPISGPIHLKWRLPPARFRVTAVPALASVRSDVVSAIAAASVETGVAPDYLWRTAYRESGLRPWAAARSSTATGLFQFIRSTWLTSLKRYGPALGLSNAAAAINIDGRGRAYAVHPFDEEDLLALRSDPLASSAIAGAMTAENATRLQILLGRPPNRGDLYVAHLLGVNGAATLEQVTRLTPLYPAAAIFPSAARANHALFYARGRPRSVSSLLSELTSLGDA